MAWPLGKPHEAAGYKKVRSTEHDIRSSSSSFSSSSSHYATGGAGNNKGSLGYGHAMGLERVREARAEQDVGLSILDNSVARLGM